MTPKKYFKDGTLRDPGNFIVNFWPTIRRDQPNSRQKMHDFTTEF